MNNLKENILEISNDKINKMIISKSSNKENEYNKVVIDRKEDNFQIAKYTAKQVFHENIPFDELAEKSLNLTQDNFMQINAWSNDYEHIIMISKKAKCTYKKRKLNDKDKKHQNDFSHNRKKKLYP